MSDFYANDLYKFLGHHRDNDREIYAELDGVHMRVTASRLAGNGGAIILAVDKKSASKGRGREGHYSNKIHERRK